jgi:hypothetical protein
MCIYIYIYKGNIKNIQFSLINIRNSLCTSKKISKSTTFYKRIVISTITTKLNYQIEDLAD